MAEALSREGPSPTHARKRKLFLDDDADVGTAVAVPCVVGDGQKPEAAVATKRRRFGGLADLQTMQHVRVLAPNISQSEAKLDSAQNDDFVVNKRRRFLDLSQESVDFAHMPKIIPKPLLSRLRRAKRKAEVPLSKLQSCNEESISGSGYDRSPTAGSVLGASSTKVTHGDAALFDGVRATTEEKVNHDDCKILQFLKDLGLPPSLCSPVAIETIGATNLDELSSLTEGDLVEIGKMFKLTFVQRRKLIKAVKGLAKTSEDNDDSVPSEARSGEQSSCCNPTLSFDTHQRDHEKMLDKAMNEDCALDASVPSKASAGDRGSGSSGSRSLSPPLPLPLPQDSLSETEDERDLTELESPSTTSSTGTASSEFSPMLSSETLEFDPDDIDCREAPSQSYGVVGGASGETFGIVGSPSVGTSGVVGSPSGEISGVVGGPSDEKQIFERQGEEFDEDDGEGCSLLGDEAVIVCGDTTVSFEDCNIVINNTRFTLNCGERIVEDLLIVDSPLQPEVILNGRLLRGLPRSFTDTSRDTNRKAHRVRIKERCLWVNDRMLHVQQILSEADSQIHTLSVGDANVIVNGCFLYSDDFVDIPEDCATAAPSSRAKIPKHSKFRRKTNKATVSADDLCNSFMALGISSSTSSPNRGHRRRSASPRARSRSGSSTRSRHHRLPRDECDGATDGGARSRRVLEAIEREATLFSRRIKHSLHRLQGECDVDFSTLWQDPKVAQIYVKLIDASETFEKRTLCDVSNTLGQLFDDLDGHSKDAHRDVRARGRAGHSRRSHDADTRTTECIVNDATTEVVATLDSDARTVCRAIERHIDAMCAQFRTLLHEDDDAGTSSSAPSDSNDAVKDLCRAISRARHSVLKNTSTFYKRMETLRSDMVDTMGVLAMNE